MIDLNIETYCSNCPEFDPHVNREIVEYEDFTHDKLHKIVTTIVSCEHKDRCEEIRKFIEKEK